MGGNGGGGGFRGGNYRYQNGGGGRGFGRGGYRPMGVEWGVLACLEGAVGAHQAAGEVMGVTGARSGAAVPTRGEEEDISRVVKA